MADDSAEMKPESFDDGVFVPGGLEFEKGKFPALDEQLEDLQRERLSRRATLNDAEDDDELDRLRGSGMRFRQELHGNTCFTVCIDFDLLRDSEKSFVDELDRLAGLTKRRIKEKDLDT